jgi:hypothetical protein
MMMRQLAHHPTPRAAEPIRGAVAAEAVEIYRTLITVEPAGFISMLRSVLRLQVAVLPALGRVQDAQVVRDWLVANLESPVHASENLALAV